jgi:endonuclease/exonuclease/phosphatase family metal-dependent hydrolase
MRVLTWNLWGHHGDWQPRREVIISTLKDVLPDICGLQEVYGNSRRNFAAELAAQFGMSWAFAAQRNQSSVDENCHAVGNVILSRWPIIDNAQGPLAGPDVRSICYAKIQTPHGPLPFFCTHLSYGPRRSALRKQQALSVAQFILEHAAGCNWPPILTGDFNAEPESDEIRSLSGVLTDPIIPDLVLLDVWRHARPEDSGFTWSRRNANKKDSDMPDSRIDYILVGLPHGSRGRVTTAWLAGTEPINGIWPSDHFAVVAELQGPGKVDVTVSDWQVGTAGHVA